MWLAGLGQRQDGQRLGRLAGGDGEGAGDADRRGAPALQRVEPRLEHRLRRVHDAGVDVADLGQREQVGGVRRCRGTGSSSSGRSARRGPPWSDPGLHRRGSGGSRNPIARSWTASVVREFPTPSVGFTGVPSWHCVSTQAERALAAADEAWARFDGRAAGRPALGGDARLHRRWRRAPGRHDVRRARERLRQRARQPRRRRGPGSSGPAGCRRRGALPRTGLGRRRRDGLRRRRPGRAAGRRRAGP